MKTIGIDLSTNPRKTAICTIEWDRERARLTDLRLSATGNEVGAVPRSLGPDDWAAIDAPFGWPVGFVEWLRSYADTAVPGVVDPPRWRLRNTDLLVATEVGKHPLSVSSDRIASTARFAAGILASLSEYRRVDRVGDSTRVVECYPAATLARFLLPSDRYKGGSVTAVRRRTEIIAGLSAVDALRSSDDVLDALVCALSARMAARGLDRRFFNDSERELASTEGWIRFPSVDTEPIQLFGD